MEEFCELVLLVARHQVGVSDQTISHACKTSSANIMSSRLLWLVDVEVEGVEVHVVLYTKVSSLV